MEKEGHREDVLELEGARRSRRGGGRGATAAARLIGTVLPTLLVLACPLSMLAMMVGMGKMGTMQGDQCALPARSRAALSRSRDEQLVTLRRQLADLEAQQRTLAEQLHDLEEAEPAARRPLATGADIREQRAR